MLVAVKPRMKHLKLVTAGLKDSKFEQIYTASLLKAKQLALILIGEGGHDPQQVFNVEETGLFWKRLPTRTYISKTEKRASGFKASKDRVTLLLGGNANGDFKFKPFHMGEIRD